MQREPRSNAHFSAFFLLIFLLAAFLMSSLSLWQNKDEAAEESSWLSIFKGEWAEVFEPKFNKELAHADTSKDLWGILNFGVYKEGRKGVLVGQDGWLYTAQEFDYSKGAQAYAFANLEYIRNVHFMLERQGVDLVVALVPAKSRVYREHLGSIEMPHMIEEAYNRYFYDLRSYGLNMVNLDQAFKAHKSQTQLFMKTDTHWTPEGAAVAAQQVAAKTKAMAAQLQKTEFETTVQGQQEVEGDLQKFIPLGPMEDTMGPENDVIAITETAPVDGQADEDALFGSVGFDVVLIGTSYSADPRWNFIGALKQEMGTDVLNLAKPGYGPFNNMDEFLGSQTFEDQPPKLIIWEIPERYVHTRFFPKNL